MRGSMSNICQCPKHVINSDCCFYFYFYFFFWILCVCVCVCVFATLTHSKQTHTDTYMSIHKQNKKHPKKQKNMARNVICNMYRAELNLTATYFKYYALGGSAFGWNDVGSPDMCVYAGGTYCYTPLLDNGAVTFEHGCCLPGVCTGLVFFFVSFFCLLFFLSDFLFFVAWLFELFTNVTWLFVFCVCARIREH